MFIRRRFVHFSSKTLGNAQHSFALLDQVAKVLGSYNKEMIVDHLQRVSKDEAIYPLNAAVARWKFEFLQSPSKTLNPKKVIDMLDGWKGLVESIGAENSLQKNSQLQLEELLRPNAKSYMHVIQAVATSIDECSHRQKRRNNLFFIDSLLRRLVQELQTDFSIQPNFSCFSAVMNAWTKSHGVVNEKQGIPSAAKKVEELLQCMEKLNEEGWHNLQPNVVIYNILLNAWAKEGEVKKIEDTLQRMIRMEGKIPSPDSISYTTLLSAYAKLGTVEAALKADSLLHQMLELYSHGTRSAKPNVISFSNVIQCHAHLGNGEKAEEWLGRIQHLYHVHQDPDLRSDLAIYNSVIQAWVKAGEPEKAEELLRRMMAMCNKVVKDGKLKKDLVQPNSRSFNIVLSSWAKIGEAERAEAILMEMHRLYVKGDFNTRPTVVSYNTVLDSYAQKTIRIFSSKKENYNFKNRNVTKSNFNTAIIEGENAPWNRAEAVLNHMIDLCQGGDLHARPTARTWNTVINVCAKAGRIDQAEKIFERFISVYTPSLTGSTNFEEDMFPSVRSWNILLSSCIAQGNFRKAEHFWSQMKAKRVQPDIVSYNTLLNCYVYSSKRRKKLAKKKIRGIFESIFHRLWYDPNAIPNHITYLAVINFWINQDAPKRAELFLLNVASASEKYAENGAMNYYNDNLPSPNRKLFHYVLTSWGEHKAPKKAEELLLKMVELSDEYGFDIRPTMETYNRLLNCWAKSMKIESGERAELILREMEELVNRGDNGATPDIFSYNSVLNAWSNSGDGAALTRINNLILEMLLKGSPSLLPDSSSYGIWLKTISLHDELDKRRRVEEVIKTMKIHNFKPNKYIRGKIRSLNIDAKERR